MLLLVGFAVLIENTRAGELWIENTYSCDIVGNPQVDFPKKTNVYFNVTLVNPRQEPQNVTVYLTVEDELQVPVGSDQLTTTIPVNASESYIMKCFIPQWAVVGFATTYVSVWTAGEPVDNNSTWFYIGPEDLISPEVHVLSPENVTYHTESVPLIFTVNEKTSWIGFSIDNSGNVTVNSNITLGSLLDGSHSLTVYAKDLSNNTGLSQVTFTVLIIHDVSIINVKISPAQVYIGENVNVTVTVQNEGSVSETFNVTIYGNEVTIATQVVPQLPPGNSTDLDFAWNTSGLARGHYALRADIPPISGEIDVADNTRSSSIALTILSRPDISLKSVNSSKDLIGQGYFLVINVSAENQGDYTEKFNLTIYANATEIYTEMVTLPSGGTTVITFLWNTTGFAGGNYTISAYSWTLPGETDIDDNTVVSGIVRLSCIGDVDGDFITDGKDFVLVRRVIPSTRNSPNWTQNADINGDGVVDNKDYQLIKSHIPSQVT